GTSRPRRSQRQDRTREAEHEGEQRRRPDFLRGTADRRAEGGEAGAAGDDRGDPEREPSPVEIDEETEAGEHQQRDDDRDDDAEQDLLAEQRRLRDEPSSQPREGVLLAPQ